MASYVPVKLSSGSGGWKRVGGFAKGRPRKALAGAEALGIEPAIPTSVAEPSRTVGDAAQEAVSEVAVSSTAVLMVENTGMLKDE